MTKHGVDVPAERRTNDERRATAASTAPRPQLVRDGDRPGTVTRVAAIDIGSNSIRQIVADVAGDGSIRVVDEMKAAPRLGAGLDSASALSDASMRSAANALVRMATLARQLGAERVEAVATSAVRDATNRDEFLRLVKREANLTVRLLGGDEEARLSYLSALAHFDLGVGRAVVMDIGGGSLELALSADGLLERLISLPFGALRLTERFLDPDKSTRKRVRKLRKVVRDEVKQHLPVRDWRGAHFIGSGGTFTNLAGMYLARQGVQSERSVHGTKVPRVEVEHLLDQLQDMTIEERQQFPGLNPGRADIIVAGLAVVAEVLARLEARELEVSAYGIREGLLLHSARVLPTVADPGVARERSVRQFAERCHYEAPHAQQVQRLALMLFDSLGARLGCTASDRQILEDAALLHDVGYHINYDKHHKHSLHLIGHAELLGMSPDEQVLVANVARYHRGKLPSKAHPTYASLDAPLRRRVRVLSAILRVADGLDRGHVGAVDKVKVRWLRQGIRITPIAKRGASIRLELWGASRKCELLEKVTGSPIFVVGPDGAPVEHPPDDAGAQD